MVGIRRWRAQVLQRLIDERAGGRERCILVVLVLLLDRLLLLRVHPRDGRSENTNYPIRSRKSLLSVMVQRMHLPLRAVRNVVVRLLKDMVGHRRRIFAVTILLSDLLKRAK